MQLSASNTFEHLRLINTILLLNREYFLEREKTLVYDSARNLSIKQHAATPADQIITTSHLPKPQIVRRRHKDDIASLKESRTEIGYTLTFKLHTNK